MLDDTQLKLWEEQNKINRWGSILTALIGVVLICTFAMVLIQSSKITALEQVVEAPK